MSTMTIDTVAAPSAQARSQPSLIARLLAALDRACRSTADGARGF